MPWGRGGVIRGLPKVLRWRRTACGPTACPGGAQGGAALRLQPSPLKRALPRGQVALSAHPGPAQKATPRGARSCGLCLCVSALHTQPSRAGPLGQLAPPPALPTAASLVGSQPRVATGAAPEPSFLRPWCSPTSLTDGLHVDLDMVLARDSLCTWCPCSRRNWVTCHLHHSTAPTSSAALAGLRSLLPPAWRVTEVRPESFLCPQLPGRGHPRRSAWRAPEGGRTAGGGWVGGRVGEWMA